MRAESGLQLPPLIVTHGGAHSDALFLQSPMTNRTGAPEKMCGGDFGAQMVTHGPWLGFGPSGPIPQPVK